MRIETDDQSKNWYAELTLIQIYNWMWIEIYECDDLFMGATTNIQFNNWMRIETPTQKDNGWDQ